MLENELLAINKAKGAYEIAKRATKDMQDFAYSDEHIKFEDYYYDVRTEDGYVLTLHLPTVLTAMENYTRELNHKYLDLLGKYKKEEE